MAKKLSVYRLLAITEAMDKLKWYGRETKWTKNIIKQLRKRLRKGA